MIDVGGTSEIVYVRTPKFYHVLGFIKLRYNRVFLNQNRHFKNRLTSVDNYPQAIVQILRTMCEICSKLKIKTPE